MTSRPTLVLAALLALLGCGYLWVALRSRHHRDENGGELFVGLALALGLGALLVAAGVGLSLYGDSYLWQPTTDALLVLLPVLWAALAARRAGITWFTRRRAAATGVLLGVVFVASETAGLALQDASTVAVEFLLLVALPQFALFSVVLTLLVAGVAVVVAQSLRYEHLRPGRSVALSVTAAGPWLTVALGPSLLVRNRPLGVGFLLTGFAVGLVGAWTALARYHLFETSGAAGTIGPEEVVETLEDPVVVTDADGRVLDVNPTAADLFATTPADAAGVSLSSVLGLPLEDLRDGGTVQLKTTRGHRQFEPTTSSITGPEGNLTGYSFVLRDVTDRRTREQRLAVLNRVLRHNLRNRVSVIDGYARSLGDDALPDGGADVVETIAETADDLVELGEKARTVERLMAEPPTTQQSTDPATVVRSTVETISPRYPDCSFAVEVTDEVTVDANPRVLEPVVEMLVENGAEHNDAADPVVTVEVGTEDDEHLVVTVVDNGPGIPETERAVLERGDITPLEHGSGLGLWVAKWGATRLGGVLSLHATEPRGTLATVQVPLTRRADPLAET